MNGDEKKNDKAPAVAAPAKDAVTPPPATPETNAAVSSVLDKVVEGMMGGKPATPDAAAPDPKNETPAAAAPEKKDGAAPVAKDDKKEDKGEGERRITPSVQTDPPKPVKKKKAADAPSPQQLAADITRAATEAATRAVAGAGQKPEAKDDPKEVKLNKVYSQDEDLYRHLATTDPKYKTLIEDLNKFADDFSEYKKKWVADHPGEKFDPDNEEVAAWMDQNEPKVSDRDMAKASGAIEGRKATAEIKTEANKKLQQEEAEKIVEAAISGSKAAVSGAAQAAIVAASGASDAKFTEELVKQVMQDPVAELVVERSLTAWQTVIEAAGALFSPGGGRLFDESNPAHQRVAQITMDIERQLSEMEDASDSAGRQFATRVDYSKMTQAERAKHYCVGGDAVIGLLNRIVAADVAERLSKIKPKASTGGDAAKAGTEQVQKPGQAAPAVAAPAAAATPEAAAPSDRSVAVGTGGPTIVPGKGGKQAPTDVYEGFITRMVGG